jgi:hypothetical protein
MYEDEIRNLQAKMTRGDTALETAIALMRAAQPKDEAAEREHCLRVVDSVEQVADTYTDEQVRGLAAELILRERAAVRAECAAELAVMRVDVTHWKRAYYLLKREIARQQAAESDFCICCIDEDQP